MQMWSFDHLGFSSKFGVELNHGRTLECDGAINKYYCVYKVTSYIFERDGVLPEFDHQTIVIMPLVQRTEGNKRLTRKEFADFAVCVELYEPLGNRQSIEALAVDNDGKLFFQLRSDCIEVFKLQFNEEGKLIQPILLKVVHLYGLDEYWQTACNVKVNCLRVVNNLHARVHYLANHCSPRYRLTNAPTALAYIIIFRKDSLEFHI